jgi:hypothetical protein
MALPETVRVKLSSEEAGAISLTSVVVRDLPLRELVELMLPLGGKDLARIRQILLRGTLVSGASRFRWEGWEAADAELTGLLATFPDPEPGRPFSAERCVRAVLRAGRGVIEVEREAGARTRFRRSANFWDVLMQIAASSPRYAGYSYRHRADRFEASLSPSEAVRLREAAALVIYSTLRDRIQAAELLSAELFVER